MDSENHITCSSDNHLTDKKVIFINVQDQLQNKQNLFMCEDCFLQSELDKNNVVSYSECLDNKDKTVILNWPPKMGSQLIKNVKNLTSQNKKDLILQQIDSYFNKLQQSITNKIQEKKKKILIDFNEFELDSESIINVYNNIAEKNKIQEILQNASNNNEQLTDSLQDFFSEMVMKADDNRKQLIDWIKKYEKQENKIQFHQAESINNITTSLIDSIQFIYEGDDIQEQKEFNININQLDESALVKFFLRFQTNNIELITKNSSYLKRIEKYYEYNNSKYNEIIKIIGNLNKLSLDQIKDIEILTAKIADLTLNHAQDYLEKPEINETILPNSSSINSITQMIYPFSSVNKKQIQKILKQYPIFEISKIEKYKPIQFNMVHSSFLQSSSFKISKELNCVHIYSNNCDGTVYSDFILENNKKYIIRFKTNLPFFQMKLLDFGLIREDKLNEYVGGHSNSECLKYGGQCGLEQVKNNLLFGQGAPQYEQLNEIEMRVCIDDNTLVFTDYPNYKTYNFKKPRVESAHKMDQTQQWRIGVSMSQDEGTNKVVSINQFVEVDKLPEF